MATTLKVNRGTTYSITINYQRDGVATTLVGATVRFTVKSTEFSTDMDDSDALIAKDVTTGNADGEATITLLPADTATLPPADYFFDIKVEDADGNIYKLDEGKLKLDASPTNRLS